MSSQLRELRLAWGIAADIKGTSQLIKLTRWGLCETTISELLDDMLRGT